MPQVDVRKLAAQLDAAQAVIDEIRITSGCTAFGPLPTDANGRVSRALRAAERVYQDRKKRSDFVGSDEIFGEPAWDILLDLFIRQAKDEEVSFRSACLHASGPDHTTIRWLKVLEKHNLVSFYKDESDDSKHFVHLSPAGYEGMLRYLETILE